MDTSSRAAVSDDYLQPVSLFRSHNIMHIPGVTCFPVKTADGSRTQWLTTSRSHDACVENSVQLRQDGLIPAGTLEFVVHLLLVPYSHRSALWQLFQRPSQSRAQVCIVLVEQNPPYKTPKRNVFIAC